MILPSLPLLLPFFLFIFLIFKPFTKTTPKNLIPGPRKLPLIGNLHQMLGSLPHHSFTTFAKKHGPIIHLQLGENSTIVISSAQLAKEAFTTHDLALADRATNKAAHQIFYGCTDIAFAPYSNYWRQMRKICTLELLSTTKFKSFESIRHGEMSKFIESIRASSRTPINLGKMIYSLQNMIVCRATVGNGLNYDQGELIDAIVAAASASGGFDVADLFPSLKFLHILGSSSKSEKIYKKVDEIFDDIINERMEKVGTRSVEKEEDLLDVLLRLKESGELEFPISFDNIKAVLMDLFTAGTDSSATTIECAMAEMLRKPSIMKKAQAEIRQTLKGKKVVNETDIQNMTYLKLILKETLRLHPTGPLLIPRKCRKQCEIGGYTIPVNAHFIVNIWAVARDPEYWDNAESFEPERFVNSCYEYNGSNFEYMPFGAGRRMCPGIIFGTGNVMLTLAKLLFHFDWKLPEGMKVEDIDMTEVFGGTTKLKNNLYAVAIPYSSY